MAAVSCQTHAHCIVRWYRNIFNHGPWIEMREVAAMLNAVHARGVRRTPSRRAFPHGLRTALVVGQHTMAANALPAPLSEIGIVTTQGVKSVRTQLEAPDDVIPDTMRDRAVMANGQKPGLKHSELYRVRERAFCRKRSAPQKSPVVIPPGLCSSIFSSRVCDRGDRDQK
jgi:hypothetical protein